MQQRDINNYKTESGKIIESDGIIGANDMYESPSNTFIEPSLLMKRDGTAEIKIGEVTLYCKYQRGTYRLLLNGKPAEILDIVEDYIHKSMKDSYIKKGKFTIKNTVNPQKRNSLISTMKKFMHLRISKKIKNQYNCLLVEQGGA